MALGIRFYTILNLILVLLAARTIFGEVNTQDSSHKVRRSPVGSSGNSIQWTKDDNINKLRKEIIASLPADIPAILLNPQTQENKEDTPQDLTALEQVERVATGQTIDTDARDNLYNFLSRQSARNNYQAGLESKRNGFFFGKRNGFFFGKRDTEAVKSDLCTSCGPQNIGQCVMFGTCCSPQFGCYFMTQEATACTKHHIDNACWNQDLMPSCGRRGICAADALCCSPKDGACRIDLSCSTPQKKNYDFND
ncbi:uncharacterized protein [Amphiura filiformis]|uniref:uncharacterized protein n=1 Tax=Amphiura filiformis TaxID=82378 RepID=UPI003B21EA92